MFGFATCNAQSQTYNLNIVTNPPWGGIVAGAGMYDTNMTINCNIQATNGWYISGVSYTGTSLSQPNSYPSPADQWSHQIYVATTYELLGGPQVDFTTYTNFNGTMSKMSSDGILTVSFSTAAPILNMLKTNQIAITKRATTLSGSASGRQPIYYQWQLNGTNIAGANSATLIFTTVQLTNAGAYSLVASNIFGQATNTIPLQLTVLDLGVFGDSNLINGQTYKTANYSLIDLEAIYPDGYVFYTLDGTEPDFTANQYYGSFFVYNSCTIRAIAYSADFSEFVEAAPANISIVPSYQLTVLNYGGGTVSAYPSFNYQSGQSSYGTYLSNSIVTLVAVPSLNSTFINWSGASKGGNPTNTITINQDTSLQCIFGTSLNVSNIGNGTVTVHPVAKVYPYGYVVQVIANPEQSNCFVQWRNAATGSQNPLNLTVSSPNSTIAGIFTALPSNKVSLTVLSEGAGFVSVSPSANIYLIGTTNLLTAYPNLGQTFINWSGDISSSSSTVSVVMNRSKSVTAHFSHPFTQSIDTAGANIQFTVNGLSGDTYNFFTSTNLINWTPLNSITEFFDPVTIFDSMDKTMPVKFYKVVAQ